MLKDTRVISRTLQGAGAFTDSAISGSIRYARFGRRYGLTFWDLSEGASNLTNAGQSILCLGKTAITKFQQSRFAR